MKKSTLSMLSSLVFLAAVVIILGVIYTGSFSGTGELDVSSYVTPSVDITSLEAEAKTLISGRDNNAGVPIAVPKDKMGKTNPFSSPE